MRPVPDPARRLVAAVSLRAVRDYAQPLKTVEPEDRVEAGVFLWSVEGRRLLAFLLGVPEGREQAYLLTLKARRKK